MKRRFLGVPVPIIVIGLAILLVGGGALAAFLWQQQVPATVRIIGAEVAAYEDEACSIPLTDLDFGEMRPGESSNPVDFYIKNQGDDPVYCALAEEDLDTLLALFTGDDDAVPSDPSRLALATGDDTVPAHWQETATTATLADSRTPSDTALPTAENVASWPATGVIKIDDELIYYGSHDTQVISNLQRGYADTTATAHSTGATITLMQWVEETSEALYNLDPDEVLPVSLYLTTDPDITRSDKPFTLIIEAKDTPY